MSEAHIEVFVKWMDMRGFHLAEGITFGTLPDGVYGALLDEKAPHKFSTGKRLFTVPVDALLDGLADGAAGRTLCDRHHVDARRNPWPGLIVSLMAESAAGAASQWKPFMDVLPQPWEHSHAACESDRARDEDYARTMPLLWSREEQALLRGTETEKLLGVAETRDSFTRTVWPHVKDSLDACLPPEDVAVVHRLQDSAETEAEAERVAHDFALARFLHWGCVVLSRAFDAHPARRGPVMTPMADMLNHRTGSCNAHLEAGSGRAGALPMRLIADVAPGGELINTYGDLPESELLRKYGFTEAAENPFDTVDVDWAHLGAALGADPGAVAAMLEAHEDVMPPTGFTLGRGLGVPLELRAAIEVLTHIPRGQDPKRRRVERRERPRKTWIKSREFTLSDWRGIADAVQRRASEYGPSTLAEDRASLAQEERATEDAFKSHSTAEFFAHRNSVAALRVRVAEKSILDAFHHKCLSHIKHLSQ